MIAWLDRTWRLLATGLSFALFGVGGVALALTVFPLLNLFVADPEERARRAQKVVHTVWRLFVHTIKVMGVVSFDCEGAEILRAERGAVIIANHPSLLDIVFIMSFMERTQCVVKASVWRNPFMSGVVKATNYIPNLNDPQRLLHDCAEALKAGNNLVIFPEGSRTPPGQKRTYQRGFAHIALLAGAPIRLVTLQCNPPTLFKGEPWHNIPSHRPHWAIKVHERIDVAPQYDLEDPNLAARKLCAQIERRIEECLAI
jgi:1-acyl-sn-glycerol-3-phosphate acyltransferase